MIKDNFDSQAAEDPRSVSQNALNHISVLWPTSTLVHLWVSTILIVHLPQNSLPQKLVYDLLGLIQSNFPFFCQENMKNWMNPVFQVVMLVQLNFVMISDCWLIGCAEVLVGHSISNETTFVNIEWKRTNFCTYLAIAHKTKYAVVPIHTEECWSRHLVTPDCLCVCIICSLFQSYFLFPPLHLLLLFTSLSFKPPIYIYIWKPYFPSPQLSLLLCLTLRWGYLYLCLPTWHWHYPYLVLHMLTGS